MTGFDPADTLSGHLPSLPPLPPDDPWLKGNGGPLNVLHPWHPWDDDYTEATPFFTRLINQCGVFATVFAVEERERAKAADRDAVPVRRFMQPLHHTAPMPAIEAPPVPYPDLDERELAHEWDTGPGTAILTTDAEPRRLIGGQYMDHPGQHRHRLKDQRTGRFIRRDTGEA